MALAGRIQGATKRAIETFTEHEVRYVAVNFVESRRLRSDSSSFGAATEGTSRTATAFAGSTFGEEPRDAGPHEPKDTAFGASTPDPSAAGASFGGTAQAKAAGARVRLAAAVRWPRCQGGRGRRLASGSRQVPHLQPAREARGGRGGGDPGLRRGGGFRRRPGRAGGRLLARTQRSPHPTTGATARRPSPTPRRLPHVTSRVPAGRPRTAGTTGRPRAPRMMTTATAALREPRELTGSRAFWLVWNERGLGRHVQRGTDGQG